MNDLPLNALRAFAAVYECGGQRAAARRLKVTHSSVNRHLRELEAWLDTDLFERAAGRRRLVFTREGEALGKACLANFKSLNVIVNSLKERHRPNAVVVSTTPSFAARWLLPRLGAFNAAYPHAEVSVLVDQQPRAPSEEGADLSIRMGAGPWPGFDCSALMNDQLTPVASPRYLSGKGTLDAVLRAAVLLHDRDPNASWSIWCEHFGLHDLDARPGPRFTSSDLVLRAAEQGLGVALARLRLADDALKSGALVCLDPSCSLVLEDAYWIVLEADRPGRSSVVQFTDWLKSAAARQSNGPDSRD